METPEVSLEESEAAATRILAPQLSPHNHLIERAFNLAALALESIPTQPLAKVPKSRRVAASLLVRLMNDLRSVEVLVNRGYAIQGLSLATSIYETAYTMAFIGSDETAAQRWIDHDDPTKQFRDVWSLTRRGLMNMGAPDVEQQAKVEYRVYRQMCMAKHANPILQMEHGITIANRKVEFCNGPETSDGAVRASWFALEHSTALVAVVATGSFINNHVPQAKRPELVRELHVIGTLRKRLEAAAQRKWGTADPFKGKW
jgi:hypothetical protein